MRTPDTSALRAAQQWLPTGQATRVLGVSADTLKRYAMRDEFLIDGKHWRRGPHRNSPMVWNIPACQEAIRWRGRTRRSVQMIESNGDSAPRNERSHQQRQPSFSANQYCP